MTIDERSDFFWTQTNPGGNVTTAAYPSRVPTVTPPIEARTDGSVTAAKDGILPCGNDGSFGPRNFHFLPYGQGSPGQNFTMMMFGWTSTPQNLVAGAAQARTALWIPTLLAQYTVTLGGASDQGVVGGDLGSGNYFAANIVQNYGPVAPAGCQVLDWFVLSPANASFVGMISMRSFGFRYLEVCFGTNSSATSCNALWKRM